MTNLYKPLILIACLGGVLIGSGISGLVAPWALAHEEERLPFVHLTSDCFTGGMVASDIKSYGAWPEPAKGENGQDMYILNVYSGPTGFRFCWKEKAGRDAALDQVLKALGR